MLVKATPSAPRALAGARDSLSISLAAISKLDDADVEAPECATSTSEATTPMDEDVVSPFAEDGEGEVGGKSLGDTLFSLAMVAEARPRSEARPTKHAWTPGEDEMLKDLIEKHGAANWSRIAEGMKSTGRVGKQCRERWVNHLSPDVKKEGFTAEEDELIIRALAEHGPKWALLVKLIPGRTDNAIKNRWNSNIRRVVRMQARNGGRLPGPLGDALGEVDLNKMGPAAIAKQLLAHGVPAVPEPAPTSGRPSAKRRLSLQPDADDADDADARGERSARTPAGRKAPRTAGRRSAGRASGVSGLELLRAATMGARAEAAAEEDAADTNSDGEGARARRGFGLDALAMLCCSSDAGDSAAGCRSPRMLEAALALGGVCSPLSSPLAL